MIAIDAMGGDFAPYAVVDGALRAARKGTAISLFGDKTLLIDALDQLESSWKKLPITLIHCSETIAMADEPARSVLRKKDSSLIHAIKAVANGQASTVISAGNSGAALIAGMMHLGKLPGILRPAIGSFLPTSGGGSVFCLDLGANVDCKPEFLRQFALMGDAYVRLTKGIAKPKVALLSNGSESSKGNQLVQQTHALLVHSSLEFIGNCEPNDIFNDVADVVVCEGFSGNIMLKAMEASVSVITQWLREESNRSWVGRCAGLLGAPVFKRLRKNIKKAQRGGALLLGVSKPLIIAHGSSNASAIEDAIYFAKEVVASNFQNDFNNTMSDLLQKNQPRIESRPSTVTQIET